MCALLHSLAVLIMGISFEMDHDLQQKQKERSIAKARAAQQRAREKQLQKQSTPEYKAKRQQRQREAMQKLREKQSTPEAIKKRKDKANAALAAKKNRAALSPPARKPSKSSRGLKGRTPTAVEKKVMDIIGQQPCVACAKQGIVNTVVCLHHIDGRTKPNCHAKVLPLCSYHHDTPLSKEERLHVGRDMFPVHAKGSYGGKAAFENAYGTQEALLKELYDKLGLDSYLPQLFLTD